ncbi:hypothetical protein C8R41DRAFT_425348 [Lentinula lateritia]|uniref:Secreted protein n=1 Tax=Lentinula lateritia TaxID=40482 RepID=A0ABQ8VVX8_9AGAR|nr:hypothetical protein C8R41DRAFT_425348 [Lentinula lateritia]
MIPVPAACNLFALSWQSSQVIAVVILRLPPCVHATFFSETPARRSEQQASFHLTRCIGTYHGSPILIWSLNATLPP